MMWRPWDFAAWGIGGAGLLGTAVGWFLTPPASPHAWLAAVNAWWSWPMGCMGRLLTHSLTGGRWDDAVRPQLVAGASALPLLAPGFVPVAVTAPSLYPWLKPDVAVHLDNSFYFASSLFGRMRIAEMGLFALSASIFGRVVETRSDAGALRVLGRLLLSLALLWAYLDFVQLLIVWQSDLPREAPWYVLRWSRGWGDLAAAIAAMHLALPFFVLPAPSAQESRIVMALVAGLLIAGGILRCWWLVIPASGAGFNIVAVFAMLGVIGVAVGVALRSPLSPWMPAGAWRRA